MMHDDIFVVADKHIANKALMENILKTATVGTLMSYYTNSAPYMAEKDAERLRMSLNK